MRDAATGEQRLGERRQTGEEKAPDSFTDGKWIGSAMGHDDDLFVQVTVAGGDIAGISALRATTPSASDPRPLR
ncbi:MAG: hypothetical protein ACLSGS_06310 [Adlercreutzia sp.]